MVYEEAVLIPVYQGGLSYAVNTYVKDSGFVNEVLSRCTGIPMRYGWINNLAPFGKGNWLLVTGSYVQVGYKYLTCTRKVYPVSFLSKRQNRYPNFCYRDL
jgi:hypothetical protein